MLLSIDPGVRACGCAVWDGDTLARAALVVNPVWHGQDAASAVAMAHAVCAWSGLVSSLAIECPRVYDAKSQKGDQNTSIIPLTLVVGAIAGRFGHRDVTQFFPREWKGTLDGDTFIRDRVIPALSAVERARVVLPSASLAHNVWDGVGVGLKALGRLEPRRVYHKES